MTRSPISPTFRVIKLLLLSLSNRICFPLFEYYSKTKRNRLQSHRTFMIKGLLSYNYFKKKMYLPFIIFERSQETPSILRIGKFCKNTCWSRGVKSISMINFQKHLIGENFFIFSPTPTYMPCGVVTFLNRGYLFITFIFQHTVSTSIPFS